MGSSTICERAINNSLIQFSQRKRTSSTGLVYLAYLAMESFLLPQSSLRNALVTAYIVFTTMMACRVFCGVALGRIENSPTQLGITSTGIAAALQMEPLPPSRRDTYDRQWLDVE